MKLPEPVAWWVTLPNGEIDRSDEPIKYKEDRPLESLIPGCGHAPLFTESQVRELLAQHEFNSGNCVRLSTKYLGD